MDKLDSDQHPHFFWLVLWRGLLGLLALYVVVEKPLSAVVVSLVVLGCLLLVGEVSYRYVVYLERKRLYEERQRELRQKRLEEARLRYEQMKETRRKERRSLMALHDDEVEDSHDGDSITDSQRSASQRNDSRSVAGNYSPSL